MKLRIAILGTRGIPNNYGGFECFAEHLSQGLAKKGHEVYVYNSHNHPNRQHLWNGVKIIHCYDPGYLLGSTGQFVYDLNCVLDARKRKYDILLFLGYTSSSIWGKLYPGKGIIIYNMDGLEWMRTKYSRPTQRFLQYAEKLAIKYSDHFVADSAYIKNYLQQKYNVHAEYIAYGADILHKPDESILLQYGLRKQEYNMLMARMEPENNIETILDGYHASSSPLSFIVIGNTTNKFGSYLKEKFSGDKRIQFPGALFNQHHISNLIFYSNLYFHGHSVGGTNPSLLEAMGSYALIVAQGNIFNRSVLGNNAFYFNTPGEVTDYSDTLLKKEHPALLAANAAKIDQDYSWNKIIHAYEAFFLKCYRENGIFATELQLKQSVTMNDRLNSMLVECSKEF
jgi:glycosyltransferase involved in cell wall biosynthesis